MLLNQLAAKVLLGLLQHDIHEGIQASEYASEIYSVIQFHNHQLASDRFEKLGW